MDGGAIFRVQTEERNMGLTEMLEICLHKNEVGRYAYNDVDTLLTQIKQVPERQLYKYSANGMKGLASNIRNTLKEYRSTIHIKKRNALAASRAAVDCAITNDRNFYLEITSNRDT